MYAIKTDSLTKKYKDVVAVDNLDLCVKKGELISLLGVNGAGKTTTIKMLCCLTQATSGNAYINDKSIIDSAMYVKSIIGVSPQETAIAPALSVYENLQLICGVHGFSKQKTADKINELVKLFALEKVISKKAAKLSGGWQRRLSIAMALISEPEILFLDEPTLGLDVIARYDLWEIVKSLKGNVTIVLTTHYMEEAEALSDRIAIMKDGKLIMCDTAQNIKLIAKTNDFEQAFVKIVKGAL